MNIKTYLPNGAQLSTVFIPEQGCFESCFFYNLGSDIPESEVVAHYDTKADAVDGHIKLLTDAAPDSDLSDMVALIRKYY